MAKEPTAGRVKTRLGRDIGAARAVNFYRHNLASVTARLAADPRWQTLLSVAPEPAMLSRRLPAGIVRIPQLDGDLGARMQAILDSDGAGSAPPGLTVIIGTDIPAVAPHHIAAAFRALGRHDVVFGPATDGGFWLVGMKRLPHVIDTFRDVRWSVAETLQDCLDGLSNYRVAKVAMLRDADEITDLKQLGGVIGRRILPVDVKN